jgi:circadian clock protein KaiC
MSDDATLHVSTLADTWIHLSYLVRSGERNRAITIVKSRGKGHSNQVRELVLSSEGITLENVYSEEGEVLMGTMRTQREARAAEKRRNAMQAVARERERMESTIDQLAARIGEQQIELRGRRRELAMDAKSAEDTSLRSLQERDNTSILRRADEPKGNKKRK